MAGMGVIVKDGDNDQAAVVTADGALLTSSGVDAVGPLENGLSFSVIDLTEGVADDDVVEYLIRAPATGQVVIGAALSAGGDAKVETFEGPTVTADGTAVFVYDKNRQTANTAATLVFKGPTGVTGGQLLGSGILPGGTGKSNSSGGSANRADIIMAQGTDYVIRVTNVSGAVQPISITLSWIENNVT